MEDTGARNRNRIEMTRDVDVDGGAGRGRRRIGRGVAALALAAALAGCFGAAEPAHSEYFVVPFEAATSQPTADGRRALAAAGEAARRRAVSRVVVQGGPAAIGKVRAALAAAGVPAEKIVETPVATAEPAEGGDVTVQVTVGKPAHPEKE
jgi:ABC-type uncharacterized transport system auxiliary subunit